MARATGWLAMVMAVAFVVGDVWGSLRGGVAIPLAPAAITLLPSIVAVAAAAVLVGGPPRWRTAAAAYLAVLAAHAATTLPTSISFVWEDADDAFLWWIAATAVVALGVGVLAVMLLRAPPEAASTREPALPLQGLGVVGGVVLAASGGFAWSAPPWSAEAGFTFVVFRYGVDVFGVASVLGMLVLLVVAAASFRTDDRERWLGLMAGLVGVMPLAVTSLFDRSWQEAGMVLAPGWWLALAGQLVLAVVLVLALARGGAPATSARTSPAT